MEKPPDENGAAVSGIPVVAPTEVTLPVVSVLGVGADARYPLTRDSWRGTLG